MLKYLKYSFATLPRTLFCFTIMLVLFNEYFVYVATKWYYWKQINCLSETNCTRILLVADPQILGETFDKNFYNTFAIYDNDRTLKSSYHQAINHAKPNVVCFLGDLMDEGSVSYSIQYERYLKRFKRIFPINNSKYEAIHIPGDNDIGGENSEIVSPQNIQRFLNGFNEKQFVDIKNQSRFFNINLLTHHLPNVTSDTTPAHLNRIIITHISLLSYSGYYSDRITSSIKPHIVFSAHLHISRIITYPPTHIKNLLDNSIYTQKLNIYNTDHDHQQRLALTSSSNSQNITNSQNNNNNNLKEPRYLEIIVPTCSYRMGEKRTGYGLAVLENHEIRYTVLWLPNRFTLLYTYLLWFSMCFLILLITWKLKRCFKSIRSQYKRLPTKIMPDKYAV